MTGVWRHRLQPRRSLFVSQPARAALHISKFCFDFVAYRIARPSVADRSTLLREHFGVRLHTKNELRRVNRHLWQASISSCST